MDEEKERIEETEEEQQSPSAYIQEELDEVDTELANLSEIGTEEIGKEKEEEVEKEPEEKPEELEKEVEEKPQEEVNLEPQAFKKEEKVEQEQVEQSTTEEVVSKNQEEQPPEPPKNTLGYIETEQAEWEKESAKKEREPNLYPERKTRRKRGTIAYKDDNNEWVTVAPPYKYKRRQKNAPEGVYKTGKKSIQIIGGQPNKTTPTVDLGFAVVKMSPSGEVVTEYRQGGTTGRVVREVIPQPVKTFTKLGLRKSGLPQYQAGNLKVYLVNGDYVKRHYNIPFSGGNDKTLPDVIPTNEIWVAQQPNVNKMKKDLLYQLIERRKINQDKDFGKAYEEAKLEIERIGNDIEELDRSINFEVASNPEQNMAYQQPEYYNQPPLTKEGGLRKRIRKAREIPYYLGYTYLHHRIPVTNLTGNI